jgi:Zn-dependent protease with chaperone function
MPAETSRPPKRTPVQQQVLDALQQRIEPVPVGAAYKLGLLAVAAAMLLLPLLYAGLIFLIGHTIYWQVIRAFTVMRHGQHFGQALLLFGLVVIGVITLLFLVKPIFVRGDAARHPLKLKRSREPFLFEYVEAICRSVGAPPPKSIVVDGEVNAAAGFGQGIFGFLTSDLTLVIGLPLVSGLTVRQFTGVLSHEFGHFAQGTGLRLSYLIRSINFWFMRAAFERHVLDRDESRSGFRISMFLIVARFFIWLTRLMLYGVMLVGHGVSCFMMREMEYDADRHETRVVGPKTFALTCRRITDLSLAHQMAFGDLGHFMQEERLADDFPALVVSNVPHIPKELRKLVRKFERDQQTGFFDTHPTNLDRIACAEREQTPGLFDLGGKDYPTSVLFSDFKRLCRAYSIEFYKEALGDDFKATMLHPVDQLIEQRDAEIAAGKSLDRYFQTHIPILRPLRIADDADQPPKEPKQTLAALKTAREQMLKLVDEYEGLTERYEVAEESLLSAGEARTLLDVGLAVKAADFRLHSSREDDVDDKLDRSRAAFENLGARMLEFESAAEQRLSYALQLLHLKAVWSKIDGGEALHLDVQRIFDDAQFISSTMAEVPVLRLLYRRLGVLCSRIKGRRIQRALFESIAGQMQKLRARLKSIQANLGDRFYPFDHAVADKTLKQYALPIVPDEHDLFGLVYVTQHLFERLAGLQMRLFAQLTHAAEKVETAVGLPQLDERKPKTQRPPRQERRPERAAARR